MPHSAVLPSRAVNLEAPDHLPACPDCGDLAFPGATVCEACGTHLLPDPALLRQISPEPVIGCGCDRCELDALEEGRAA